MEISGVHKKSSLRGQFRKIREGLEKDQRSAWDEKIRNHLFDVPGLAACDVFFVYLSRSGEVDTHNIVQILLERDRRVLTPSPDIKALPHDGLFKVADVPGALKLSPERCHESRIDEIDLVIVPGIAWDQSGHRIGFGRGYFDRLLEKLRPDCLTVGLAYECQITDSVPYEAWDQPVRYLVTERGVIDCYAGETG